MTLRAPSKLGSGGRRLWADVTSVYSLRPDEARLLEEAAREADLVDKLEKELAIQPLVTKGYKGQPRVNPIISEIRQHRAVLRQLLSGLKLPDEPVSAHFGASERSTRAREAALARWGRT